MKTADFYDGYWQHRKAVGHTLTGRGGLAPKRIGLAAEFLRPVPGRRTRIVDLGCGDGALGDMLQSRGDDYELVGADVSAVALELAEHGYSRTVRCDMDEEPEKLAELDLANADYVVALEVLEHLRYPEALLRVLTESCGSGTRYVFSFPNVALYGCRYRLLRGKLPHERLYNASEHLHLFTLDSFREMLGSCGLEITAITAKYAYPWVLELLPGKLLRRILRRYVTLFGDQVVVACAPRQARGDGAPIREPEMYDRSALLAEPGAEPRIGRFRKAVARCRYSIAYLPVVARRVRSGYYRLPSQKRLLAESNWNVLILLDACRADAFRRVVAADAPVVRSLAPCTRLWIHQFGRITARRPESPDILWVTANPVVDRDCARYGVRSVRLLSIWRNRWDRHGEAGIPTVHPDAVGDEVRRYLRQHGQPQRMVIHYLQPHAPFIGTPELAAGRAGVARDPFLAAIRRLPDPEDAVRRGDLTWQEVREAYDGNLKLVWDSVRRLLPDLKGRVIVTSDHGELLGEDGRFGHECPWTTELLRHVPWMRYDGEAYEPTPVQLDEERAGDADLMASRLRALGYV
jgi:SAM-dependent methyltransferase